MIRPSCLALSLLAAWPGVANAQQVAAPPYIPPPAPRPIPPAAPQGGWPPVMKLAPLQSPDWSDPDLYPPAARRQLQEGSVTVETWVGKDGYPKDCRTTRSSGYPALDEGTCLLLMRVRFVPPVDEQGRPVEATQRSMIVWRLSPPPTRFAASMLTVRLTSAPGAPPGQLKGANCEVSGAGPLFPQWSRNACAIFSGETPYYLGEHRLTARAATLVVAMTPTGSEPAPTDAGLARQVAFRRIHFELDRKGKAHNCRSSVDQGLAPHGVDRAYPCGIFLFQHSFEKIGRNRPARSGVIEIRAYVDGGP